MLETAIGFSSWTSAQWLADHEEPIRQGSRHRQNAPYQRMRTGDATFDNPEKVWFVNNGAYRMAQFGHYLKQHREPDACPRPPEKKAPWLQRSVKY